MRWVASLSCWLSGRMGSARNAFVKPPSATPWRHKRAFPPPNTDPPPTPPMSPRGHHHPHTAARFLYYRPRSLGYPSLQFSMENMLAVHSIPIACSAHPSNLFSSHSLGLSCSVQNGPFAATCPTSLIAFGALFLTIVGPCLPLDTAKSLKFLDALI